MKILNKIPKEIYLACSGGKDSMTVLNFLLQGRRDVHVLYYNHNTEHGQEAQSFIYEFCKLHNLNLSIGYYTDKIMTEAKWREGRYNFFSKYTDKPIITAHHLQDNIETWLMSSISGVSKFIPYSRDNIIRPFLLTTKKELNEYCIKHNVKWIEDPSNSEDKYSRNKIRNKVLPVLEDVNKGLEKVFYYKCLSKYEKDGII